MISEKKISVVIANYNKASTIGKCLEAALCSRYRNFEVIVVDDMSDDGSVDIIKQYPCKLIRLNEHSGASKARNVGASHSSGDIIFFTDADCLLKEDTLSVVNRSMAETGGDLIVGGTYTRIPADKDFFSLFQSVFINYSETKNAEKPDYIATHAMAVGTETFRKSKGFQEDFMPILEDVEFSHRMRNTGHRLVINPAIEVQHIFNFSLSSSLLNAVKKSKYWTMYSIKNKDLLTDSGTASAELKINVLSYFISLLILAVWIMSGSYLSLLCLPPVVIMNVFVSRSLLKAFYKAGGIIFAGLASLYYIMVYPLPVGTGAVLGVLNLVSAKGKPG